MSIEELQQQVALLTEQKTKGEARLAELDAILTGFRSSFYKLLGLENVKEISVGVEQALVTVVQRQVVQAQITEDSIKGQLAVLGAKGFFDAPKGAMQIYKALKNDYQLEISYENFRKNACPANMNFWIARPYGYFAKVGHGYIITELGKANLKLKVENQ